MRWFVRERYTRTEKKQSLQLAAVSDRLGAFIFHGLFPADSRNVETPNNQALDCRVRVGIVVFVWDEISY